MQLTLDPTTSRFLLDHRVNGVPLLPTVMALDLMARAAAVGPVGALFGLRDVVVGPPVLFPGDQPRTLELLIRPAHDGGARQVTLGTAAGGDAVRHYTALVQPGAHPRPASASLQPATMQPGTMQAGTMQPATAAAAMAEVDVYPPYFHGPLMQVLARAGWQGSTLWTELRSGLRPLSWGDVPTVTAPTLLELWMQSCGLWELTRTGRMMIPRGLDAVDGSPEARWGVGGLEGARAQVWPRRDEPGNTVFDGEVTDASGSVLLSVRGYRTAELGTGHVELSRPEASRPEASRPDASRPESTVRL